MGVLACSRNNCQEIMCDRYSSEFGYICDECLDELIRRGPNACIETFMNSKKECGERDLQKEARARERFHGEFTSR